MKTIVKELNLLDIEDVEEALSSYWGEKVSIANIECTLVYCPPLSDPSLSSCMYLVLAEGKKECASWDLFGEPENYIWKGKKLSLSEPWLPTKEIFTFDVSVFKQFKVDTEQRYF